MKTVLLVGCFLAAFPLVSRSEDLAPMPVKATFLITGLHCAPCTRTVESSLPRVAGIRAVQVDWRSKNATIEFDEAQLSAGAIAQRIASTPHMMGRNMRYGGWLALHVDEIADKKRAEDAKAGLSKVPGVTQVVTYPEQSSVGIKFDGTGKLTTGELIKALEAAGFKAANLK